MRFRIANSAQITEKTVKNDHLLIYILLKMTNSAALTYALKTSPRTSTFRKYENNSTLPPPLHNFLWTRFRRHSVICQFPFTKISWFCSFWTFQILILSYRTSQNGQTHFKSLVPDTARFFKYVWPFWGAMD